MHEKNDRKIERTTNQQFKRFLFSIRGIYHDSINFKYLCCYGYPEFFTSYLIRTKRDIEIIYFYQASNTMYTYVYENGEFIPLLYTGHVYRNVLSLIIL